MMYRFRFFVFIAAFCAFVCAAARAAPPVAKVEKAEMMPPFGRVTLIDEVNVSRSPDAQNGSGAGQTSQLQTLLGRPCRVLPPQNEAGYFAYRLGKNKNLKPGQAYVLSVEFPDDAPRTTFVLNRGAETNRGFSTGAALGDALFGYTNNNPESLSIPHTQKYQTWQSLFFLHDRFPSLNQPRGGGPRPDLPQDGFLVIIAQLSRDDGPLARGAAVSRIRLYAVAEPKGLAGKINFPPAGLPRRHLFWREEMGDGVIDSQKPDERGVARDADWFENKARLAQFLNMDTLCKDLLEFGHNQGWDAGGNDWFVSPPYTKRWEEIVRTATRHHLSLLPYYEWAGSTGEKGLGRKKRAVPLKGSGDYTNISWSELFNADITDPDALTDAEKLLDATITRYKTEGDFLGAWLRPRPSHIPVSFSDAALQVFAFENGGGSVTRETLQKSPERLAKYRAWWMTKRRDFAGELAAHLQKNVRPDAFVLYTPDASEPGRSLVGQTALLVTDDLPTWDALLKTTRPGGKIITPVLLSDVVKQNGHGDALMRPLPTWGQWEMQNSDPEADPQNYKSAKGALLTYSLNRAYTAQSALAMEAFRTPSGLAVAFHYPLNETRMHPDLGYFVSDTEHWGPYCTLAETQAMASGDPRLIGYLASSSWSRGFPGPVREWNRAFLSLPAAPSRRVENTVLTNPSAEIAVRAYATEKNGTYYAVLNTGYAVQTVTLRLQAPPGSRLFDAASGTPLPLKNGMVQLTIGPGALRSLRVFQ